MTADLVGPEGDLTEAQAVRLATVIGEYKAVRAALDAGMSASELESQEWLVDVQLLQPEAVQPGDPGR